MPYKNSPHYLHRCYREGYAIGFHGDDDDCPYCIGTLEWCWWHDGWSEGVVASI